MAIRFLILIGSLFFLVASFSVPMAGEIARPLTFSGPQFQIEDLSADLYSDGKILIVRGQVKNLGYCHIKGFLTVYYKGAHQEVLKTLETEVNKNQPIPAGHAAKFEAITNVQNIPALTNVSVEFTETSYGLPLTKRLR